MYLYRSAVNYAKLLGKNLEIKPNCDDFNTLYYRFKDLLPVNQELYISEEYCSPRFYIVHEQDMERLTCFIPCKVISNSEGEIQELYIEFFRHLQHSQRFTSLRKTRTYEYRKSGQEDPKDIQWNELFNRYENGDIGEVLGLIETKPKMSLRKLENRIEKYDPKILSEERKLNLMLEGINLFKEKKSITNYGFLPIEDDNHYDSFYPLEIDRLFCIVYEKEDLMENCLISWIESDLEEGMGELIPGGDLFISPQTKRY